MIDLKRQAKVIGNLAGIVLHEFLCLRTSVCQDVLFLVIPFWSYNKLTKFQPFGLENEG